MEPTAIATTAALVMKYVLPAIRSFGEQVLEKTEDSASDTVAGFGKRLLGLLLSRRARAGPTAALEQGIERRVRAIGADPGHQNASIQLQGAIEDLLAADSELLARIRGLLDQAIPEVTVHQGDGSFFAGRDIGTVYANRDIYYAREDPVDMAAKHFAAGEQHLALGMFREAVEDFRQVRIHDPRHQAAYYLGAVAALDGQKAFRASLQCIREAERLIHGAIELQDSAICHYFLAYLKYDYYERKSLEVPGAWRAPFLQAGRRGITPDQVDALFRLLSVENPLPGLR
jgi:tetratricopeptide (TPR) repeat protein